jgi:arabinose-5-phosphate isomerase
VEHSLLNRTPKEGSLPLADADRVIGAAIDALTALRSAIDGQLMLATQLVANCKGRLVISGVGKSGIAARKIASTCASLGTPALFLHPTDAAHGDLGKLVTGDLLLCISVSGEAEELLSLAAHAQLNGIHTIAITANAQSPLAKLSDLLLPLPQSNEGGPMSMVPMASTVATIVLGDALATLAARVKQFSPHQLATLHPGGRIGRMLKPVHSIMHAGQRIPRVLPDANFATIAEEIGQKGFGVTAVVDPETEVLIGAVSDGDLRRNLVQMHSLTAMDVMTSSPQVLRPNDGIDVALEIARNHRIGAIFVTDPVTHELRGIVHVQDLLRLGLI